MEHELTAAAQRVLVEAARWSGGDAFNELPAPALLLGLLSEPECRAAIMLARYGVREEAIRQRWPQLARSSDTPTLPPLSTEILASLTAAARRLRDSPAPLVFATEHLLLGLLSVEHDTGLWLRAQGLDPDLLEEEICHRYGHSADPLPFEEAPSDEGEQKDGKPEQLKTEEEAPSGPPHKTPPQEGNRNDSQAPRDRIGVLRVLDAAGNRTREGLRVVEDYVRFVLDDRHLTDRLKQLRHQLTAALAFIPLHDRLAARETQADIGTSLSTSAERERRDSRAVLTANFVRVQEGLRSLEEFAKTLNPKLAAQFEELRYRTYTLHRAVEITKVSLERLGPTRLYVLVDGQASPEAFSSLVGSLIDAGVDVIQLRDKQLDDRRLLGRAQVLRERTRDTDTLFVMNDRPDLAVLAGADGVHVGQEELSVKDVRSVVGPEMLIGVSTHSIDQARQAVLDGADYLGVGPTFPSGTKQFERFPGLDFLREVASEIRLPAFAIGGINRENLVQVLATGIKRIAVAGAITSADDPARMARELATAIREA